MKIGVHQTIGWEEKFEYAFFQMVTMESKRLLGKLRFSETPNFAPHQVWTQSDHRIRRKSKNVFIKFYYGMQMVAREFLIVTIPIY